MSDKKELSSSGGLDDAGPTEESPLMGTESPDVEAFPLTGTETPYVEAAPVEDEDDDESSNVGSEPKSITESLRHILLKRPRPNPCLFVFYLISGVAAIDSLCLFLTQVVPIIIQYPTVDYLFVALRCYVAGFCVVFILVEANAPIPFLQVNNTFQSYISRGFLYSFIGLIGLEQAYNARVEEVVKHSASKFHIGWTPLFMQISSWSMVCIGHTYILMGLLCLRQVRDKLSADYQASLDEYHRGETVEK